jgi:hypothetical protein
MEHTGSQAPIVSGSGRYVEYGAVAGAHRPQPGDLTQKRYPLTAHQRANNIVLPIVKLGMAPSFLSRIDRGTQPENGLQPK